MDDIIFFIVVMVGGKIEILAKDEPSKEEDPKIWEEMMSVALEQRQGLKCSITELSGKQELHVCVYTYMHAYVCLHGWYNIYVILYYIYDFM